MIFSTDHFKKLNHNQLQSLIELVTSENFKQYSCSFSPQDYNNSLLSVYDKRNSSQKKIYSTINKDQLKLTNDPFMFFVETIMTRYLLN